VVGATGAVSIEMIKTLEKRNFPVGKPTLLAHLECEGNIQPPVHALTSGSRKPYSSRNAASIHQIHRRLGAIGFQPLVVGSLER
jgi:aspartate-semialdehyde dehydrogenase